MKPYDREEDENHPGRLSCLAVPTGYVLESVNAENRVVMYRPIGDYDFYLESIWSLPAYGEEE